MPRKFVGTREIAFVNSITRELHQHVVDEEVYYYAIMLDKTMVDDLYNEAIKKVWAPPIRVSARVLYDNLSSKAGLFGLDSQFAAEVYFHTQELIERNLVPREGDFIEYGQQYYEITSVSQPQLIFGQINNKLMTMCKLVPAREGQFAAGGQSGRNIDHSHPLDNAVSHTRQAPDQTRATYTSAVVPQNPLVYWGVSAATGSYDSVFVLALPSTGRFSSIGNIADIELNIVSGQYGFIVLPETFAAEEASFVDVESGFEAGLSLYATVAVIDPVNGSSNKQVWRTRNEGLGPITVRMI